MTDYNFELSTDSKGINIESIQKYIVSEQFNKFMGTFQYIQNLILSIKEGGTKTKTKSRKKRKMHCRKTIKYGGNPENYKRYKRYILTTIFLISLSLPSKLVPNLFHTVFTSTQKQLSDNIFKPFNARFPELVSGSKESNAAMIVEYGDKSIKKNYNDFNLGGVLVLNGLYALYLNGWKVYNYVISEEKATTNVKPENTTTNVKPEKETINIEEEQLKFKSIFEDTVELMSKESYLIEIPIPTGSKLLIPMDTTLYNEE